MHADQVFEFSLELMQFDQKEARTESESEREREKENGPQNTLTLNRNK